MKILKTLKIHPDIASSHTLKIYNFMQIFKAKIIDDCSFILHYNIFLQYAYKIILEKKNIRVSQLAIIFITKW